MEPARAAPPWLDWFSAERLAGFKGNTLMEARQPGPARQALQHVLESTRDNDAKQRSVTLADLAAVAIAENDPEQACHLAEAALANLGCYWYATGRDRVRAVRQALTRWDNLPCVRQFDDKLSDWNTTVSSLTG